MCFEAIPLQYNPLPTLRLFVECTTNFMAKLTKCFLGRGDGGNLLTEIGCFLSLGQSPPFHLDPSCVINMAEPSCSFCVLFLPQLVRWEV